MAADQTVIPATTLTGPNGATPAVYYQPSQLASPQGGNNPLLLSLGGTWTGLQGVWEGSMDASLTAAGNFNFANPFPMRAYEAGAGGLVSGTIAVPDNAAGITGTAHYAFPDGGIVIRFRVTALASGAPIAQGRTVDFFSASLPASLGGAVSLTAGQSFLDSFVTQYTPPAPGTGQIPNIGVLPKGFFNFMGELGTEGGAFVQDRAMRVRLDRMEEWLRRIFMAILLIEKSPELSLQETMAAICSDDGTGHDFMDAVSAAGDHQPMEVG